MANVETLGLIATLIAGFGAVMLFFRLQRGLETHERLETTWIPWADRLLAGATLVALLFVVLPLVAMTNRPGVMADLPAAACAAATLMFAGYVLAILAHHRLFFGGKREGPGRNPEPAERVVVIVTLLLAVGAFLAVLFRYKQDVEL